MDLTTDNAVMFTLFVVLLAVLVWWYRSLWRPYAAFPVWNYFFYFLRLSLNNGFPRNLPTAARIFQYNNALCTLFRKDGFFVCWNAYFTLFAFSPDAVKFFFTEPAATFEKGQVYKTMDFLLGKGLITNNGKVWAQHRKIINPTFHRTQYKSFVDVFNRRSLRLVEDLRKECKKPWIDVSAALSRQLFTSALETVVGVTEDRLFVGEISTEELFQAHVELSEFVINRTFKPWLHFDFLWPFLPGGARMKRLNDMCLKYTKQMVLETLQSTEEIEEHDPDDYDYVSAKCKPLIRSLTEAHRKDPDAFTLQDVIDELETMIRAGYHTVLAASIWTIYLLGLHPDVQEMAFDEVNSKMTGNGLAYEDQLDMPYLESVIKETFRVYPAVPAVVRRVEKDVQLGKYTVPKDTSILIWIYMLHRDPNVFPNPEKFDPDRFAPDKKDQISRFAFLPFAEGPRSCIGKTFAMMEMKVLLSHIIRNFKIVSLDQRDKISMTWNMTLVPFEKLRIQLIPRETIDV